MKPTIPEVLPLAKAYVRKPGNAMGGNLHIVLEDGNIKDSNIRYCMEQCYREADGKGVELCELLLQMTKTQRLKIVRQCWRNGLDLHP